MAKVIIDFHGVDAVDEEQLIKQICKQKDSIYHESDFLLKWVDDQEFEFILDEWLKNN